MRKVEIEDLVVAKVMELIQSDAFIDDVAHKLMEMQEQENVNIPLYERELREVNRGIDNLLNAIQQGILSRSTKERLDELEAARDELENKIAYENLTSKKIEEDALRFWLMRFRKLDVKRKEHRQMLVDTFVNAIFLYDDKLEITFNFKEDTVQATFGDLQASVEKEQIGSDMKSNAAPRKKHLRKQVLFSW